MRKRKAKEEEKEKMSLKSSAIKLFKFRRRFIFLGLPTRRTFEKCPLLQSVDLQLQESNVV